MEERDKIKAFLDEEGRVTVFPAKRKNKLLVLRYLAEQFQRDRDYTEKEVNELLLRLHTFGDPATLRRELYDNYFLDRTKDGSTYRRTYRRRAETSAMEPLNR